jgi:hypothetical protein
MTLEQDLNGIRLNLLHAQLHLNEASSQLQRVREELKK